jgi:CheY-like chemotaxis protein/HPt (histidine-containing phosphotransfer) domain-containing protein
MSIVVFPDHQSVDTSKFDASQHRGSMNDALQMLETENESDRHVLVVDDEGISRTVLRKMIERLNFDVTTVEGGKQALELLSQDANVSLLIVDVLMPEMDGLELLRIFKKAYSKDIPIIMISSSEDPDTIAQCFQFGAEDFLQKPIRFEMLKRRIEMCLDDRARRRKEAVYQQILQKERENRNRLSKQVQEQEKELQQIKSQITDTIETPMQVVMKTIGNLMEGTYSVEQYKGALIAILKSLGSRDLYRPAFSMLIEKGNIDDTTRKWLLTEFMREDETDTRKIANSAQPAALTHSKSFTPKKAVHFDYSQNTSKVIENVPTTQKPIVLRNTIPNFNSFSFDIFAYDTDELIGNAAYMFQALGLIDEFSIEPAKLLNFLHKLRANYKENPYHNLKHALDVTQFVYCCICDEKIANMLTSLEQLCLLVSALCHDVCHPGLNNNYQVNAKSPLALVYNDISVLENHHCSMTFRFLREKDSNIVENLDAEQYKEFRKITINTILATDMAHHFELLTKFQTRIQTGPLSKESRDDKQQLMNIILKCADVSNATRPFPVAEKWANMLIEEFLAQGDKERELGLTISPLMDRDTLERSQMQINFIDYIASPLFKSFVQYVPSLQNLVSNIQANRESWSARLEIQQYPSSTGKDHISTEGTTKSPNKKSTDLEVGSKKEENKLVKTYEVPTLVGDIDAQVIARIRGFNVLVVTVDQSVIDLLIKNGYDVTTASDIQNALEVMKHETKLFDIALIDFKFTPDEFLQFAKDVRQYEKSQTMSHYIAIIGLVHPSIAANSEKSCTEAGVDIILSKPVSVKDLMRNVEKALEISLNHVECVDMKLALEQSGGDLEFLKELLLELVEDGQKKLEEMEKCISELDWANLNLNAHSMKGASTQLACKPLSQACFILERAAKLKEQENLVSYYKTVQKRVNELEEFVKFKLEESLEL